MNWQAVALDDADNVAVALQPIAAGDVVRVFRPAGFVEVEATEALPFCHKIALGDLSCGDPIVRYGQCIGEASEAIRRGSWVHIHNLVSRRARRKTTDAAGWHDSDAYIQAAARQAGLAIPAESLPAVRSNFMGLQKSHDLLASRREATPDEIRE
jgi:altronate dehydratase small subunit